MSAVSSQNYYELLGISKTATDGEIREAYKKMAFKSHPDKARQNNLTTEKATATFKLVNEAYETLSNPLKRRMYDTKGSHIFAGASAPSQAASSHSAPFRSDFFNEGFRFYNFRGFAHEYKREDETIYPGERDKEATNLIDGDDSDLLDQYLKTKNFENLCLKTMLYDACKKGKLNIVKYLIEIKKLSANLNVNDGLSFTGPIFKAAAESGNLELVKYLFEIHHVDIESQGLSPGTRDTALSRAALKGHIDVVKYLVSKGANLNPDVAYSDILDHAIASRNLLVVIILVEAGSKFGDFNLGRGVLPNSL